MTPLILIGPGNAVRHFSSVPFVGTAGRTEIPGTGTPMLCLRLEHEPDTAGMIRFITKHMAEDGVLPRVHVWNRANRRMVAVIFELPIPDWKFVAEFDRVVQGEGLSSHIDMPEEASILLVCEGELPPDADLGLLSACRVGVDLYERSDEEVTHPYARSVTDQVFLTEPDFSGT